MGYIHEYFLKPKRRMTMLPQFFREVKHDCLAFLYFYRLFLSLRRQKPYRAVIRRLRDVKLDFVLCAVWMDLDVILV